MKIVGFGMKELNERFLIIPGCSIRVETLGNFEGKSKIPRQN